jgi:hypothetical protein
MAVQRDTFVVATTLAINIRVGVTSAPPRAGNDGECDNVLSENVVLGVLELDIPGTNGAIRVAAATRQESDLGVYAERPSHFCKGAGADLDRIRA